MSTKEKLKTEGGGKKQTKRQVIIDNPTGWTPRKEACEKLGIHERTLQKRVVSGSVERMKVGRRSFYRWDRIKEVVDGQPKQNTACKTENFPAPPVAEQDKMVGQMWSRLGSTANGHWHWAKDLTAHYADSQKPTGYVALRDLWIGGYLERKEVVPHGKGKHVYYRINKGAS